MISVASRPTGRHPTRASLRLMLACALALASALPLAAQSREATRSAKARSLRLGIVAANRPGDAIERIEPFRLRLSDTLGIDVTVQRHADERSLVDAFAAGRVDYAPLSASGYAMVWRLCGCIEPLAAPRAVDGTAGWRIVVVVPTSSGIEKLGDLAGRRLAVSGEDSIGGRRLALRLLAVQGLEGARAPRLETVENPRAAVKAVVERRVDAAIAWSTLEGDVAEGYGRGTLHDMVAAGEVSMTDVRVPWSSAVLPHGPHAVRADLSEPQKRRLRDMLVDLDEVDPDAYDAVEPVMGGGFLRVGHPAYAPFVDLVTPRDGAADAPTTTGPATPPG